MTGQVRVWSTDRRTQGLPAARHCTWLFAAGFVNNEVKAGLAAYRCVPPVGFEPTLTAPEAVALSPELWGLGDEACSRRPPNGRSNITSRWHRLGHAAEQRALPHPERLMSRW